MDKESGINVYTLLCLRWITNKDLLCSTVNSAQRYVEAWMGGEFGDEGILCPPETITALLIGYTPI